MHALHHLMYTLMLFMNPVVVIMYWGLVHKDHIEERTTRFKGNDELIMIKITHTYIVHSVPTLCAYALMKISDCVLVRRHW